MNKYTLIDILSKEIEIEEQDNSRKYSFDGIQIPMIQRDYAQGRIDEVEIRKRFLKAIFDALIKQEELPLDFVYGSVKELDTKIYFVPLDGQQRLTTLLLLHWYIGTQELSDDKSNDFRATLKKFTYATRSSARDFCEKLAEVKVDRHENPKYVLTNASWFYDRFKKDPTVMAMLVMLDAIHNKYEELRIQSPGTILFPSLSKLSFYILPLDGFNLTDELYIKMNARGKQLTDFENFKADLINWLQDEKNPQKNKFHTSVKFKDREMPYHLSVATKLDNDWSHLFWQYTHDFAKIKNQNIDTYYLRFWNRFLLNSFIISSNLTQEAIDKTNFFKKLYGNEGSEDSFKYEGFEFYQSLFESDNLVENVQSTLDRLAQHFKPICDNIRPVWAIKDNWNLFDEKINQRQRILFLAVCLYLQKNDFDINKFRSWIRVVWNIIIDPDIRSISAMINIMRLIGKISDGSFDIYKYLVSKDCLDFIHKEDSFAKSQLLEERLKAELIYSDNNWENEFIEVEKNQLFQGNIGFLLLNKPDKIKFRGRAALAKEMFSNKGTQKDFASDHLLMRSIISSINEWDELYEFDMGDNFNNWQLLLRRNRLVQSFISNLCDSKDENTALTTIAECANSTSIIKGFAGNSDAIEKAKHIHEQLYSDVVFHKWMQHNGAVKIKWSHSHLYVHRPRSWYDWVALDTYRNKIATDLIKTFGLSTTQACGDSNFYWGAEIELLGTYLDIELTVKFDDSSNLRIGVKDDGNSILKNAFAIPDIYVEAGWLIRKIYDYSAVKSSSDAIQFVNHINHEVFDEHDKDSVISLIM